ncbi:MAG TPA: VOC family protein, partial [Bacteroidia bacterium]|nr:VOC family protein [Bacteroidia bacterium]
GTKEHRYYIMKNGNALVGLFQGMFDGNMLTFNPGWDESAQTIPGFTDVREIEKKVMAAGFSPVKRVEAGPSGPAHFVISDPDGNVILIDQHV